MTLRLRGLIAATFTPMLDDGSADLTKIAAVTDFVIKQGANGLFVCGSTGESPSLSVQERMDVASAYVEANAGRVPVIVHVGHNSLSDGRELAAHAVALQADAIALVPPSYFSLTSVQGIVDAVGAISDAAPHTPVYYYHIPRLTGVGIRMRDLLCEVDTHIPQFAGIKFSSFEFDDLITCVHYRDRHYNILFGSDEMLLAGLAMGVDGAVGSTFNFLAPWYRAVIDAFEEGNLAEAQRRQLEVTQIVHRILDHGGHNALKAAMGICGRECGPPRLPIRALASDDLSALQTTLKRVVL